jgi:hypothetical protein
MAVILREPELIRQKKTASCWFACVKMLLAWHEGDRSVNNAAVSSLASWIEPRALSEIPPGFLQTRNLDHVVSRFQSLAEVEAELLNRGPFVGGGTVGKLFVGERRFGHAILIYGVTPSGHLLHHDPTLGAACKIKWDSYREKQFSQRLHYRHDMARVEVSGRGSSL